MADSSAFEEFVRDYQDMVFGIAVRLLGDRSEAEDVSQTVFLRAFERFGTLCDSPAVSGWLRTVTTNLCLNYLRRVRARWTLFSQQGFRADDGDEPRGWNLAAPGTQREELERRQENARLERGLRRLPAHQRIPIVLFHFEQRSYREIAALLGVTEAKVKSDIHRGRVALKTLMEASDGSR